VKDVLLLPDVGLDEPVPAVTEPEQLVAPEPVTGMFNELARLPPEMVILPAKVPAPGGVIRIYNGTDDTEAPV
jgi:hypothetical protein